MASPHANQANKIITCMQAAVMSILRGPSLGSFFLWAKKLRAPARLMTTSAGGKIYPHEAQGTAGFLSFPCAPRPR